MTEFAAHHNKNSVNKLFSNDTSVSSSATAAHSETALLSADALKDDLQYIFDISNKVLSHTKEPTRLYQILRNEVSPQLQTIRNRHGPVIWQNVVIPAIRQQKVFSFLRETDILTFYQLNKPRGYDGDANIIDMMYYAETHCPVPEVPAACYRAFYNSESASAGRLRKEFFESSIRRIVEQGAQEKRKKRIFSIAGGKMREIRNLMPLLRENAKWIEIVVLDQDKVSLDTLRNEYIPQLPEGTIKIVNAKIAELLKRTLTEKNLGHFDLIYASGLYDYLRKATGTRLATIMFQFLKPQGEMFITNFSKYSPDAGYMEAFLDWALIYRIENEVEELADDIPKNLVQKMDTWMDELKCVIYTHIVRNNQIQSLF